MKLPGNPDWLAVFRQFYQTPPIYKYSRRSLECSVMPGLTLNQMRMSKKHHVDPLAVHFSAAANTFSNYI